MAGKLASGSGGNGGTLSEFMIGTHKARQDGTLMLHFLRVRIFVVGESMAYLRVTPAGSTAFPGKSSNCRMVVCSRVPLDGALVYRAKGDTGKRRGPSKSKPNQRNEVPAALAVLGGFGMEPVPYPG